MSDLCPSWVVLYSLAHSFIELDKAVIHVISLISFLIDWFLALVSRKGLSEDVASLDKNKIMKELAMKMFGE